MPNVLRLGLLGLTTITLGGTVPSRETGLPNLVLEIAVDSLKDVALAVYAPWRGVIYYSPARQRALGPELTAFFRAHEFGHLYYHHVRTGESDDKVLRAHELEADCYAARKLGGSNPEAVEAAITFFRTRGEMPLDDAHPDGNRRARMIDRCRKDMQGS